MTNNFVKMTNIFLAEPFHHFTLSDGGAYKLLGKGEPCSVFLLPNVPQNNF